VALRQVSLSAPKRSPPEKVITGRDIVYISSIEWGFLWQAHQEIARRLAAAGNRVLYIENTGIRSPALIRDAKRVASRIGRWGGALRSRGVREVADNVFVCSPLVLPPFGSRPRRYLNRLFLLAIRRIIADLKMRDPLLWTYLPTDTAVDLIRMNRTDRSCVVYYGVADFARLTPHIDSLRRSEQELLKLSDVVFAMCTELANRFSAWNDNVHVFAPGVDLRAFGLNGHPRNPAALKDLTPLQGPVIGYIGGLHRFVDFDLLRSMIAARPEWFWVLVGAPQANTDTLQGLPNLHLTGQQPHERLAGYIEAFDVCVVPYLNTPETSTVVPTKINEYLAVGKPVVSTDLPAVCEFNDRHQVLSITSPETRSFLLAIESALAATPDRAAIEKRRRVAALSDWSLQMEKMSRLIEREI
jgi:glycosyltransferase involved in cell wall biosynthesis